MKRYLQPAGQHCVLFIILAVPIRNPMKHFSFLHVILFLLMILVATCARSQDFVVTSKNDTLRGKVKLINYGAESRVSVQSETGKKSYSIIEVRSLTMNGSNFRPIKGASGYTFMKLIKPGYLSIYGAQQPNQTGYDIPYLLKLDGTSIEVPNLGFKKALSKFLNDCLGFSERIEAGEFSRNQLDVMVDAYNACIEKQSNTRIETVVITTDEAGLSPWKKLELAVNSEPAITSKADALEIITEIKNKISRKEKVPNFLVGALKEKLASYSSLETTLANALKSLE